MKRLQQHHSTAKGGDGSGPVYRPRSAGDAREAQANHAKRQLTATGDARHARAIGVENADCGGWGVLQAAPIANNANNDPFEHEANRVASHVLATPAYPHSQNRIPHIQRQRERANGGRDMLPASVRQTLSSPGTQLAPVLRKDMEQRFGQDFSNVRLHFGKTAEQSARDVNAYAYTVGHNIVFGMGKYLPDSYKGRHLIAHELTHVVQQSQTSNPQLNRFEAPVHENIERTALGKSGAMTNEEASAVYFGNWMRDMNQLFVPAFIEILPNDAIFSLISYMAAAKFGREVTPEQFGYYIPAEHIDNPAGLVATDDLVSGQPAITPSLRPPTDSRLGSIRPPGLDTRQEEVSPAIGKVQGVNIFSVDQTGMMAYIRRTNLHMEHRLALAVDAGRTPDGMQHFGAALHAVEDLFAHSNFVEIAVDRLLSKDQSFLPQLLVPADRQVFSYAPVIQTASGGRPPDKRPVLTTGSFTGADTQISIASEIVGFLSEPLPAPASAAEKETQDRFIIALLRSYEPRVRESEEIRTALNATLPEFIAKRIQNIPLANIYEFSTFIPSFIPDRFVIPIRTALRTLVSTYILQPAAAQVQAAGLEARVADTSLIHFLRDSKRREQGQFSPSEEESMRKTAQLTNKTPANIKADAVAVAKRHARDVALTPLHVVAGPSHSQIAKDHSNSPFFGLAFTLANIAVQRLRDLMLAAWTEHHKTTGAYDLSPTNFPNAPPKNATPSEANTYNQARNLYASGVHTRTTAEKLSLQTGQDILANGGQPGRTYDLGAMRQLAATNIRHIATILRAIGKAPGATAKGLQTARLFVGTIPPEFTKRLGQQLTRAQAVAAGVAAGPTVASIVTVADMLEKTAAAVEVAVKHTQREQANAQLVNQRAEMLMALGRQPNLDVGLGSTLLYALDVEIQTTAPTYTTEQRAVLEGRSSVGEMGATPRLLSMQALTLPSVSGLPGRQALLNEARLLVAHPYESTWWESHVLHYAKTHSAHLISDIEARNEGVPFYRE